MCLFFTCLQFKGGSDCIQVRESYLLFRDRYRLYRKTRDKWVDVKGISSQSRTGKRHLTWSDWGSVTL